jgi:hypothetical protein
MRTTSEQVAAIIEVDVTIDLTPFMMVANELVTEVCSDAGYTDERMELIERWLSAHFYTNRDPRPVSEAAGPVSTTYQSAVDLNLNTSHYGQTAMLLDTAGGLAGLMEELANPRRTRPVSVHWLGTKPSTVE